MCLTSQLSRKMRRLLLLPQNHLIAMFDAVLRNFTPDVPAGITARARKVLVVLFFGMFFP
jgi:hypothetical protein